MSVVDDYGRFYASPNAIRGACWPISLRAPCEQSVSNLLAECQQGPNPLIQVYVVNGLSYLQLTDFRQQTRSKSKFPEPVGRLISDCEQPVSNCIALVGGVVGGDIRSSEAASSTEKTIPTPLPPTTPPPLPKSARKRVYQVNRENPAGNKAIIDAIVEGKDPPPRAPASNGWVEKAVRDKFPLADSQICREIENAARTRIPSATAEEIAMAVHRAGERDGDSQRSPALFLITVPKVLSEVLRMTRPRETWEEIEVNNAAITDAPLESGNHATA
jgi:hypothetical protein